MHVAGLEMNECTTISLIKMFSEILYDSKSAIKMAKSGI